MNLYKREASLVSWMELLIEKILIFINIMLHIQTYDIRKTQNYPKQHSCAIFNLYVIYLNGNLIITNQT